MTFSTERSKFPDSKLWFCRCRLESERQNIQKELEQQMSEQLQQVETTYNQKLLDQKTEYENQLRLLHTDLVSVTL